MTAPRTSAADEGGFATEGICPVCNGTLRSPAGDSPYRALCAGYRASDDTFPCQNCGGQTMLGRPTGRVPLRPDGTPCTHTYRPERAAHRSTLWYYVCTECGHTHEIDSGD